MRVGDRESQTLEPNKEPPENDCENEYCDGETCQSCCPHDFIDHNQCADCEKEFDPGEAIDRACDFLEDR